MHIATVDRALEEAACALRDRDSESIGRIIGIVQDWLGDNQGLLAALQEMHDAAEFLAEVE